MKKICSIFLGALSSLIALVLAAGCYRPAAPELTPTVTGGTEIVEMEEKEPELEATATVSATLAPRTPEEVGEAEAEATQTPTALLATPTSVSLLSTPSAVPATVTPTPLPGPSGETTHVVQPGENLFRIALRYGTTTEALAQANGIANPRRIYVGQELTIPAATTGPSQPASGETTYVVKAGDNLFRIALRYNMSYLYLARYNGIANPSNIQPGQVLRIPAR